LFTVKSTFFNSYFTKQGEYRVYFGKAKGWKSQLIDPVNISFNYATPNKINT